MGLFSRSLQMAKFIIRDGEWHNSATVIANIWNTMAALAWEGYHIGGRGFVMHSIVGEISYIPAAAPAIMASRESVAPNLRRDCSRYRPEREIVFCANGARDEKALCKGKIEMFCGVVEPRQKSITLSPPEAYQWAALGPSGD